MNIDNKTRFHFSNPRKFIEDTRNFIVFPLGFFNGTSTFANNANFLLNSGQTAPLPYLDLSFRASSCLSGFLLAPNPPPQKKCVFSTIFRALRWRFG